MATTKSLKNINFMSKSKYDSITPSDDELYAVDTPAIVETYIGDSDWYFVYSNGWCVQGGIASNSVTITLRKPYIDTNYGIIFSPRNGAVGGGSKYWGMECSNITTAGFKAVISGGDHSVPNMTWKTYGYIK